LTGKGQAYRLTCLTFEGVTICEASDDETATVISLSIAARGYVRTQTLRAFSAADISKVLDKMV